MHRYAILLPFAFVFAFAAPASLAQSTHQGHGAVTSTPGAQSGTGAMAEGEVRKVDRVRGTVTLKHGPVESLGMGPMTMPFTATDPKLLANLKEGDRVRFAAGQTPDGKLTVSRIEVVK